MINEIRVHLCHHYGTQCHNRFLGSQQYQRKIS